MSPPKSWPSLCLSVHSLFTLVSLDSGFELRAAMDNSALDGHFVSQLTGDWLMGC